MAVEVVKGEVADGGAGDDDADAGVGDLFDDLRAMLDWGVGGVSGRGRGERHGREGKTRRTWGRTFSSCSSSPRVKLSISFAFLRRTVPFVSVCEMSTPEV